MFCIEEQKKYIILYDHLAWLVQNVPLRALVKEYVEGSISSAKKKKKKDSKEQFFRETANKNPVVQ